MSKQVQLNVTVPDGLKKRLKEKAGSQKFAPFVVTLLSKAVGWKEAK